jgi:hypothetical protein
MAKSIELRVFNDMAGEYSDSISDCTKNELFAITELSARPLSPKTNVIESNQELRLKAQGDSNSEILSWKISSAENTGGGWSVDCLTKASSFHWGNFDIALARFFLILKPTELFTAVWNPRILSGYPLFEEIKNLFKNVIYTESNHAIQISRKKHISVWMAENYAHVQLGENNFIIFIDKVQDKILDIEYVNYIYKTCVGKIQKRVAE